MGRAEGMPRVDFYILADTDEASRLHYVCRLVDKVYRLGHRIWLRIPDEDTAHRLDELLWTFSQGSFVPHERQQAQADPGCPVIIGDRPGPGDERDLLINDGPDIPDFTDRFDRIAEVINQAEAVRLPARGRYTRYRDSGYPLQHHRVE